MAAPINAFAETFPQSAVVGRYFYLCQSVHRRVKNLGHSGKFGAGDGFERLVGKLPALAPTPPSN